LKLTKIAFTRFGDYGDDKCNHKYDLNQRLLTTAARILFHSFKFNTLSRHRECG